MLTFGIIGSGSIGGFWARLLTRGDALSAPRAQLAAVASRDGVRARQLAAEVGCESLSVPDLLAWPDVDAVIVCTPSGSHAELAQAALRAGKHVLVEKPVDVTPAAADRLIAAARSAGRTLGVVSQRRFDPAARLAHDAIRTGRLGRITSVTAEVALWRGPAYYASGTWRGTRDMDGGGALMNQAIHSVDLIQWLAGPVAEVTAHTSQLAHPGIEVEDVATASIRFANGALGTLLATTAAYPGRTARTAVHGDRGSVVIDDDELAYLHLAAEGEEVAPYGVYGAADQKTDHTDTLTRDTTRDTCGLLYQPHRDQLLDFCDAIRNDRPPLVDATAGRQAVAVVNAVYASAATGRPQRVDATAHSCDSFEERVP